MKKSRIIHTLGAVILVAGCGGETKIVGTQQQNQTESVDPPDLIIGAANGAPDEIGSWGEVLPWPHVPVSMAHLPDGKVLTYSGSERRTWPSTEQTYSATWDPQNGAFSEHLAQGHNMFCGTLTLNAEGDVFVAGGRNGGNSPWISLFSYESNSWRQIQNMASGGRWYPTTISLGDGGVMSAMGSATNTRNPDVWQPDSGWRVLNGIDFPSMRTEGAGPANRNWFPLLNVAPNGNVFHYWGPNENHFISTNGNGDTKVANAQANATNHPGGVHLSYDVGKLLVTGANQGLRDETASDRAFVVDLNGNTPVINTVNDMIHRRAFHQLIPLPTGEVFVVGGNTGGGFNDNGSVMEPEIWNPESDTWRGVANMAIPRNYHSTALLLKDGRVLVGGGGYPSGGGTQSWNHADAQVYSPSYLFTQGNQQAVRPVLSGLPNVADVGSDFTVSVDQDVKHFTLIKLSATTHATNTSSRMMKPDFQSAANGRYEIKLHPNPHVLIPGYWMLFAVNNDGVPSEAEIFKITAVDVRLSNFATQGVATQSAPWPNNSERYGAENAIDGDTSGSTFAHTARSPNHWWQLDLRKPIDIDSIRIWNRSDFALEQIQNTSVLVSQQPFATTTLAEMRAEEGVFEYQLPASTESFYDLKVDRSARYIRLADSGENFVNVAEVEVFGSDPSETVTEAVNLARAGTAKQSSDWSASYPASNAISGVTSGRASTARGLAHTRDDQNAWWELDLGQTDQIDRITIYNRTDCCTDRTGNFHIFVSEAPFVSQDLTQTINQNGVHNFNFPNGITQHKTDFAIDKRGRYVRIQLAGRNFLQLGEVEVVRLDEVDAPVVTIDPIVSAPVSQTETSQFVANATGQGAVQYNWNFGDGSGDSGFNSSATILHQFAEPGRYEVSVTARDSSGDETRSSFTQLVHLPLADAAPMTSNGMIELADRREIWTTNPDNQSVSVVDRNSLATTAEIVVIGEPVALARAPDGRVWVVSRDTALISVIDPVSRAVVQSINLPRGSQPWGIVFGQQKAFVALEAIGEVRSFAASNGAPVNTASVGHFPRHLSVDPANNRLYVSSFITPPLPGEDTANPVVEDATRKYGAEVTVLSTNNLSVSNTITLEHHDQPISEHQGPGVPNYLGPVTISPDGSRGFVASKQDNVLGGQLRGNSVLTFDQTVRAITSQIDLDSQQEILTSRIDHDNASIAGFSTIDPFGVSIFSALEGNRQVSVSDVNTATEITRLEVGHAPRSLLITADGKQLYVHNYLDRTLDVFDVDAMVQQGAITADKLATVTLVSNEQLDATVLRGKQLFHDARDDRLAGLDYMSCASCHAEGGHDGRVWDFTALGEGLRNTISVEGRAGTGHGLLHWTGNFDEVQDFEGQIRSFAGGAGLMDDASFASTEAPLGAAKAGLSEDLDALAIYLASLNTIPDSPHRTENGSLTAEGEAGLVLFTDNNCASCHSGETFTDSSTATLHDVGSIMQPGSGQRLGATLTGLDTPTLAGVWQTPPYLHDGSAATLQDAVAAHLSFNFTNAQLDNLAAYLIQIDDNIDTVEPPPPPPPPQGASGPSNHVDNTLVINGNIDDWAALIGFGTDPADPAATPVLDIKSALLAHDDQNFYIALDYHNAFVNSWGNGIYLDTDRDRATGFTGFANEYPIGVDYLIEAGELLRYTGNGTDYSWQLVSEINVAHNANSAEITLPRQLVDNAGSLHLFFAGNHTAIAGEGIDFFPDSVIDSTATLTDRYFVYSVSASTNQPPIANTQSVYLVQGESTDITLTGADANGDTLSFEVADLPQFGTLTGTAPNLRYQPQADFSGSDSFGFSVNDGNNSSAVARVAINVSSRVNPSVTSIAIDGSLADWAGVTSLGEDPAEVNGVRDNMDYRQAWIAHDATNTYVAYQVHNTPFELNWGYGIYFDTDGDRNTGFRGFSDEFPIGVDVIVEGGTLHQYAGTGLNWNWSDGKLIDYAQGNDVLEIAVPQTDLGNIVELQFFLLADNMANSGNVLDYYPDTATDTRAAQRNFVYRYEALAPLAYGQTLQVTNDNSLNITLGGSVANDVSPIYTIIEQPLNGSISGTAPNLVYTPDANFVGDDQLQFTVTANGQTSASAAIEIAVNASLVTPTTQWSNAVAAIQIDGNFADWSAVTPFTADAADVTAASDNIDWRSASMAHNDSHFYIRAGNETAVSDLNWGYAIYMDTDVNPATGFVGFSSELSSGTDYLIEGASLYRYTGSGTDWMWSYLGEVDAAINANQYEIAIARNLLDNSTAIDVYFRGDNGAVATSSTIDFYPDGVADSAADAVQRRFRYQTTQ